ncbi:MAG: hypothetical protein JW720_13015 [Sedimentisphaerales bacterium]|nr:hypothetical protein [Sedimentisphaerales bacterium]
MASEREQLTDEQKHAAAVELLAELKKKLHSDDISTARKAAHNLSWMQEDGLEILKDALFGRYPRTAKKAAAYGIRNMKGRMAKLASQILNDGLKHRDRTTKAACEKALFLLSGGIPEKNQPRRNKRRSGHSHNKHLSGNTRQGGNSTNTRIHAIPRKHRPDSHPNRKSSAR